MKNIISRVAAIAILSLPTYGWAEEVETAAAATDLKNDLSYFYGYSFGNMLKEGGSVDIDMSGLTQGMADSLENLPPNLSDEQQQGVMAAIRAKQEEIQTARMAAMQQLAAEQEMASTEFLQANAEKPGVQVTESGLQYETLVEGQGAAPTADSQVLVHYEGRLTSGEVFDSSLARGEPVEFNVSQVIVGWTEGLQLMKAGGKTRLTIPADLAYGPGGSRNIPPNAALVFDVELLEVK